MPVNVSFRHQPRPIVWRLIVLVIGVALSGGCKSTTDPAPKPRPLVRVNGEEFSTGITAKPPPIDQTLKSDPCAARLHAISGAMLEYYALHNRLPVAPEELEPLADLDQPLNFVCPDSGQPYVYVPAGLQAPDDAKRVVLHDPTPNRMGLRWVILMQKPRGRQPAAMWVVSLTDPLFRAYTPAPATATRPTRVPVGQ
jgi:hypothetical protein